MNQEELKQRLIELLASKVCDEYSPTCDEWQPHDCGKCYANNCHIADIADHLIANGVTIREWIPVTERLPEKGQEVLAYRGDFRCDMMNTYTYLGSGNWQDDYGYRGSAEHEGITHWMPLPPPPETEKGDEGK